MYSPEMNQALNNLNKAFSELIALCESEEFIPNHLSFQSRGQQYIIAISQHRLPYQTKLTKTISIIPAEAE